MAATLPTEGVALVIAVTRLNTDRCVLAFDVPSRRIIRLRLLVAEESRPITPEHALSQLGVLFTWTGRPNLSRPPPHRNEDYYITSFSIVDDGERVRAAQAEAFRTLSLRACTTRSELFGDLSHNWKYVDEGTDIPSVQIGRCRLYRSYPEGEKIWGWMILRGDDDETVRVRNTSIIPVPEDSEYVIFGLAEGWANGSEWVEGQPRRCYILMIGSIDALAPAGQEAEPRPTLGPDQVEDE
jgi:hypothetical protein